MIKERFKYQSRVLCFKVKKRLGIHEKLSKKRSIIFCLHGVVEKNENVLELTEQLKTLVLRLGINKIGFGIDSHHTAFEILLNHYHLKSSFTSGYQWFDAGLNFEELRFNFADFDNYL